MPAVNQTVRVEGYRELQRAFKLADKKVQRELRDDLRELAEPVRDDAERLAVSEIPRIGLPWSQMRIGLITSGVYVAPKRRGSRLQERKRPNLAGLLLGRSMVPALERNEREIANGVERLLDRVGRTWEHA